MLGLILLVICIPFTVLTLFFGTKGGFYDSKNYDGHDFIEDSLLSASCIISSKNTNLVVYARCQSTNLFNPTNPTNQIYVFRKSKETVTTRKSHFKTNE